MLLEENCNDLKRYEIDTYLSGFVYYLTKIAIEYFFLILSALEVVFNLFS